MEEGNQLTAQNITEFIKYNTEKYFNIYNISS